MKEGINIWGKHGCELPDGGLCSACCVLPQIELDGIYASTIKPENSPCPYLGKKGEGCTLQSLGKPPNCLMWHCSSTGINNKLRLIASQLGPMPPQKRTFEGEIIEP